MMAVLENVVATTAVMKTLKCKTLGGILCRQLQYYTDVIRTHARIIIALRKVDAVPVSPLSSAIYTGR